MVFSFFEHEFITAEIVNYHTNSNIDGKCNHMVHADEDQERKNELTNYNGQQTSYVVFQPPLPIETVASSPISPGYKIIQIEIDLKRNDSLQEIRYVLLNVQNIDKEEQKSASKQSHKTPNQPKRNDPLILTYENQKCSHLAPYPFISFF
jgi:hypothetical protein